MSVKKPVYTSNYISPPDYTTPPDSWYRTTTSIFPSQIPASAMQQYCAEAKLDYELMELEKINNKALFFTCSNGAWGRNRRLMIAFRNVGYLINNNATISSSDPGYNIDVHLNYCQQSPRSYKQISITQAIRLLDRKSPELIRDLFKSLGIAIPDKSANYSEKDKNMILELLQSKKATNPDAAFAVDENLRELCYDLVDNNILKVPSWDDMSFYIDTDAN